MSPRSRSFLQSICPFALSGVTDEHLGDVLDAWLADEFASDDHTHVHSLTDNEEITR